MRHPMSAPEKPCPACGGVLLPAADQPAVLECAKCRTRFLPDGPRTFLSTVGAAFMVLGKIILILFGLGVIALAVWFAGCAFGVFKMDMK
jgi:hypothetical protein